MSSARYLTQLAVDRVAPPKTGRLEWRDTNVKGLEFRTTPNGAKSWSVVYRVAGIQRRATKTLAEMPNVADARLWAQAAKNQARAGADPAAEQRAAAVNTVATVAARFLAEYVERRCKRLTAIEWRRQFKAEILPAWGARPIGSIARRDVIALLDKKARLYPRQADEVRKHLRRFFGWALERELVAADPTNVATAAKHPARERVLNNAELAAVWEGCGRLGWPFGPMFRLLLLTGQRRQEVSGMAWSEIDIAARTWTIPGARSKNARPHTVHLSKPAMAILTQLPRLTCDLVFSTTGGVSPPSGFSRARERLDEAMGEAIPPWTLHDLRRSMATGLARMGVAQGIVERVLNHVPAELKGIGAVYNKFAAMGERRAALETWGRHVAKITTKNAKRTLSQKRRAAAA